MTSARRWLTGTAALAAALAFGSALPAAAAPASAPRSGAAYQLPIDMQVQQQNEWCWVASGDTIASYLGAGTDQNTFCALARGLDPASPCPNQPGNLGLNQNAYRQLGISPGTVGGPLPFQTIVDNIDANHPVQTGIRWQAGGGHAEVIYGYDPFSQDIFFGNPWPTAQRYNEMNYAYYQNNDQFYWGGSISDIGA